MANTNDVKQSNNPKFANFRKLEELANDMKPTAVSVETIEVEIDLDQFLPAYVSNFISKLRMKAYRTYDVAPITEEEFSAYCKYLITKRVEFVHHECKDFPRLKFLNLPSWIELLMTSIGKVTRRDFGLRMIPVLKQTGGEEMLTLQQAMDISDRLDLYREVVCLVNAFPQTDEGDLEVMSVALIDGYARAQIKVEHPVYVYIAAFLGFSLRQELAYKSLYRLQYDDVHYIEDVFSYAKHLTGGMK